MAAGLFLLWISWGAYVARHTDRVPYEPMETVDGVELRRYPRTVLVETTAGDTGTAFGRLFRYLSGANDGGEGVATGGTAVAMTAPVRTLLGEGATVAMTAPVRTDRGGGPVTMAFYLPASYTRETAPVPTDPAVRLVVEPARTVAARPSRGMPPPVGPTGSSGRCAGPSRHAASSRGATPSCSDTTTRGRRRSCVATRSPSRSRCRRPGKRVRTTAIPAGPGWFVRALVECPGWVA